MTPEQARNEKAGAELVKALEARHFEAYYCAGKEEAARKIISLIPKTETTAWGGSETISKLGILETLRKDGYRLIDREKAQNQEEKLELMSQSLLCGTYLCGTNAITEDGELINIDKTGNRTAAMIFGPKRVIIACGMNKLVKTAAEAEARARNTAAPINAQRFDIDTPCTKTGRCFDCKGTQSLCSVITRIRLCSPEGRIKVILIGENLGF